MQRSAVTSRRGRDVANRERISATGRARGVFLLTSPAFIAALTLLILNDWVLKPAFSNWVTGKLSDVAGLVAFAMFGTALLPDRRWRFF